MPSDTDPCKAPEGARPHKNLSDPGFYVLSGSSANTLTRNLACRNGELDALDIGDGGNVWEANVFCTSEI